MKKIAALLLVLCTFISTICAADNSGISQELLKVYRENLTAMQAKDLGKVIATFHPDSPSFNNAKAAAAQTMVNYDLSYKLVAAEFVGINKEYAVIRIVQETRRLAGDEKFQDNTLDVLQIFKQDKAGVWKLWSSSVLAVTPLK